MLLVAWLVYFGMWIASIVLYTDGKISKAAIAVCSIVSLLDVTYLAMHDGRALILVVLATICSVSGVVKACINHMHCKLNKQ